MPDTQYSLYTDTLRAAKHLYDRGYHQEAECLLQKLLMLGFETYAVQDTLASVYAVMGRFDEAVSAMCLVVERTESELAERKLARLLHFAAFQRELDSDMLCFPRLSGDTEPVPAAMALYDEAIAHFLRAVRWNPTNPTLFSHLGITLCRTARFTAARQALTHAERLDPELPIVFALKGFLYFREHDDERCIQWLRKAASWGIREAGIVPLTEALALLRLHRYDKSIPLLEEMTAKLNHPNIRMYLSTALFMAGEAERAHAILDTNTAQHQMGS